MVMRDTKELFHKSQCTLFLPCKTSNHFRKYFTCKTKITCASNESNTKFCLFIALENKIDMASFSK